MTTVRIHIQDHEVGRGQNWQFFEAHWDLPRNHRYTYLTGRSSDLEVVVKNK
jgi:hypothetical protein